MDSGRQRAASEAGSATPEAISVNENVLKETGCFCEEAQKREIWEGGLGCGTSAVESSTISSPVKDGEEKAPTGKEGMKEKKAPAMVDTFQQRAGDTVKKATARRKKEESWDRETHVKLICAEGTAIVVEREVATECDLFRRMLSTGEQGETKFTEGRIAAINLPMIRRRILEKTVEYLQFRRNWYRDGGHSGMFQVESDIALELLFAANYLGLSDDDPDNIPDVC